jgi:hypothetical protein
MPIPAGVTVDTQLQIANVIFSPAHPDLAFSGNGTLSNVTRRVSPRPQRSAGNGVRRRVEDQKVPSNDGNASMTMTRVDVTGAITAWVSPS